MKEHIGAEANSGLIQAVEGTVANAHDIIQAVDLLNDQETVVFGDAATKGLKNERRPRLIYLVAYGYSPGQATGTRQDNAHRRVERGA
jgi:hypothetical protein